MRWDEFFGVLVGVFLILMGLFRSKVRNAYGSGIGINTPHARKNKENWDFAQKNAPMIIIKYGMFTVLINMFLFLYSLWMGKDTNIIVIVELLISVVMLVIIFVKIERMVVRFEEARKEQQR